MTTTNSRREPRRGRPAAGGAWLAGALVLVAGAAAGQVPAPATPGGALPEQPARLPAAAPAPAVTFPIPPTVDRPLEVEEGERLFVTRFELKGAAEHPEQGIDLEELSQLIEDLRVDRQGLNKIDEDGFTAEEKAQITEFMRRVVDDPQLDMSFADYEALVDKLREEKARREAGMTIGQMQQIAAAVTEYYRSAGFILAQAFIPAQEVEGGVVTIEVQEGRLGNVLVEGNKRYSDAILAKPFEDLIDAPVSAGSIESAVLLAGDNPGLTVFGVFQPGREVGTSDLVLKVQSEDRIDGIARVDNHGTSFTGELRFLGDITWNNPTGVGDRLTGTVLRQYLPKRSIFGQIAYERPLWPGLALGASFQRNPFTVGGTLAASQLAGSSTIGEVYLRQQMARSRRFNAALRAGLTRAVSRTKRATVDINVDQLASLGVSMDLDNIDPETRSINVGSLGVDFGLGDRLGGHGKARAASQQVIPSRRGGSGRFASNNFWKANASYSRLQTLTENQTLLVRLEGQYTNTLLTSLEEFSVGGPNSVRAYNVSERLADIGLFGSAEWTINAPFIADEPAFKGLNWGQVLRVSFFSDFAYSKLNDPLATDIAQLWLAGYGAGVSVNIPGQFQGRLQWAHPIGPKVPGDLANQGSKNRDKGRWWFDFTYEF